jgi:hypothetical protein
MRYRLHASRGRTRGLLIGVTAILVAGCGKGVTGPEVPPLPPGVVAGPPGELSLLRSNPVAGSTVDHRFLDLDLSWTPSSVASPQLDVVLLDARGHECVDLFTSVGATFPSTGPPYGVSAGLEGDIDGQGFLQSIKCAMPFDVATLAGGHCRSTIGSRTLRCPLPQRRPRS